MIIVEITGGLGNQMFQYALYCKLKKLYPGKAIKLDITEYDGKQTHGLSDDRRLELSKLSVDLGKDVASKKEIRRIKGYTGADTLIDKVLNKLTPRRGKYIRENLDKGYETSYLECPNGELNSGLNDDVYLSGYWQCEKYFSDIKDELKSKFIWETNSKIETELLAIRESNSVAVHIRRGDYLYTHNATVYGDICTKEYYKKAIEYMREKLDAPQFFFFSNDLRWVKDELVSEYDDEFKACCHFVTCNGDDSPEYDMYLMKECRHNIIANSSFSWWGAWLGDNTDKIVIAPHRWFNNHDVADQICDDWIKI